MSLKISDSYNFITEPEYQVVDDHVIKTVVIVAAEKTYDYDYFAASAVHERISEKFKRLSSFKENFILEFFDTEEGKFVQTRMRQSYKNPAAGFLNIVESYNIHHDKMNCKILVRMKEQDVTEYYLKYK